MPRPATLPISAATSYNDHQGEAEQKGPRKLKAKLRANLAMCGNPAGIVVCRSGYEART
jgi:hypothetical protein